MLGVATTIAEWLTAGGTVFAALGTVGAVAIALWQTVGPKQAKLTVHCWYGEKREGDGRRHPTLTLSATHVRGPGILLQTAYLTTDGTSGPLVDGGEGSTTLPALLHPGQSAQVTWDVGLLKKVLELMKHQGGSDTAFVSAMFVDSLGRRHEAALPQIFVFRDDGPHPLYL
ncbi:MAG TPA: hypothetical protein VGO48_11995 [Conexibacter sp.]|nr:hypothetical protein [Conexibacter sp.]